MPEIDRTRDLVIFKKGDAYAVTVSPAMAASVWLGGQGVEWVDVGRDEMAVTFTDGRAQAFMLWGSDESSDRYTAMTRQQPHYQYGVVGFGGWVLSTLAFEEFTYASRLAGPLVPIVYTPQDDLLFSLRGRWTIEDEWTLSGDPRAPNTNGVGVVVQAPTVASGYLTIQVRL
jgi:hypothetical protein